MGSPTETPTEPAANAAGTEVATRPAQQRQLVHVPLGQALEDMDQAWRMAQAFAAADIVPKDLQGKPANAFLVMLYGQRLGLPPEVSITAIGVVKGRPRMSGQLLLAKVREAGHTPFIPCATCAQMPGGDIHRTPDTDGFHRYKEDRSDTHCTFTIVRAVTAEEHTETFTLDDAVQAGLCKIKDGKVSALSRSGEPLPWQNYTKRMLMWRALGFVVDVICPEIKMGFVVEGELDGGLDPKTSAGPVLAPVAAAKQAVAERTDQPTAAEPDDTTSVQPGPPADTEPAEANGDANGDGGYDADAIAAELQAIEQEHVAEYGTEPPEQQLSFGPVTDAGR